MLDTCETGMVAMNEQKLKTFVFKPLCIQEKILSYKTTPSCNLMPDIDIINFFKNWGLFSIY